MRGRPAVSVLISTVDRLDLVRRAVASVRAQTFRDVEVVLLDNATSDGTRRWGTKEGLRYLRLERRLGPAAARNYALARARGRLIAFLDDDDLWRPALLEELVGALSPRALVAYCDHDVIDADDSVLEPRALRLPRNHHPAFESLTGLRSVPHLSAALIRREAFERVGGFDEGFRLLCDDVDFFYRVALARPRSFRFVPEPLLGYRRWDPARQTAFSAATQDRDPRQRERLLDVACFHRKHAAWLGETGW